MNGRFDGYAELLRKRSETEQRKKLFPTSFAMQQIDGTFKEYNNKAVEFEKKAKAAEEKLKNFKESKDEIDTKNKKFDAWNEKFLALNKAADFYFKMGLCYESGLGGVKKNGVEAKSLFAKAMAVWQSLSEEIEHTLAEVTKEKRNDVLNKKAGLYFAMGICHSEGRGVDKSTEQAEFYSMMSATIWQSLGEACEKEKAFDQALNYYMLASQMDWTEAHYALARMFATGNDVVTKDMKMAVEYYQKAAQQKHVKAKYELALLCFDGQHVKRDFETATMLFEEVLKDANNNFTKEQISGAQYCLALCYLSTQTNEEKRQAANALFFAAAKSEHVGAQYKLGYAFHHGFGIPKSSTDALIWLSRAAAKGCVEAEHELAQHCFYQREDLELGRADFTHCLSWIAQLQKMLSLTDEQVFGKVSKITRDTARAAYSKLGITFLTLAMNKGHAESAHDLGVISHDGNNVAKDSVYAVQCCVKAYDAKFYENRYDELRVFWGVMKSVDKKMANAILNGDDNVPAKKILLRDDLQTFFSQEVMQLVAKYKKENGTSLQETTYGSFLSSAPKSNTASNVTSVEEKKLTDKRSSSSSSTSFLSSSSAPLLFSSSSVSSSSSNCIVVEDDQKTTVSFRRSSDA